jgi:hypothetical protein
VKDSAMNRSKHNKHFVRLQWACVVGASALLAACSDGGGIESPAPPPPAPPPVATGDVPASAQASPSAWTAFVRAQAPTEAGKPLDLSGVVAPFSETEAPLPI